MARTDPSDTKTYFVQMDGWVQNRFRKTGDSLTLTETEAQYDVLDGKIALTKPAKAKAGAD